ncbi:MAG: KAP family NTPase [Euzebyales bacterium]|nr:KAP family NTPase [Euzebyales bacterium]
MDGPLFGDDPRTGEADAPDVLGRTTLATHVVALLDRVRSHSPSSVLAVIASWGAGKTTLLNLVSRHLREQNSNWLIGEYNPWLYSDLDSAIHGFFASLRDALPEEDRWSEARARIGQLGRAVSPLGKLGALAGLDLSGLIEAGADAIAGDTSATALHARAEKALRDGNRPILMILDDVDRLTPDELLVTFKLVRLVGRLPNVYYLLAYDERTITELLSRTELAGGDEARARDYLEKMVQVRLDLPPLRDQQAADMVDAALERLIAASGAKLGADDTVRLSKAYHAHLRERLATPRAINRFVAQADAFHALVFGEVDFVDFLLMTFIRTAEPGVYEMLRRYRQELTGTDYWNFSDREMTLPDRLERWRERLRDAGVAPSHVDGVLGLLGLLFLPVRSALERMEYGSSYREDVARRRGVGHADYFDRYYSFGVPDEDIPDAVVALALQQLASGDAGPELQQLAVRFCDSTDKVLRKLRAQRAAGFAAAKELTMFLSEQVGQLPNEPGAFLFDPRRATISFVEELLGDIDAADGVALLRQLATSDEGLWLAARVVDRAHHRSTTKPDGEGKLPWLNDATDTMTRLTADRLAAAAGGPLADVADDVFNLIWAWHHFAPDDAGPWLVQQTHNGNWGLIDVLARLVTVGVASEEGRNVPTLGDLSLGSVDALLGLDYVLEALADEIDRVEIVDRWVVEPTPENRRSSALAVLRRERDRRASTESAISIEEPE